MTIGKLFNANNVVVGQAACLLAPKNTALPDISKASTTDPFDLTPWTAWTINTGSVTSFTLTWTPAVGTAATTASLTVAGLTAAQIKTALEALSSIGTGNAFTGGVSPTWTVAFAESVGSGVLTMTPTGGAGSSLTGPLWAPVGATDQGWKFSSNKSTNQIQIEEQSASVKTTMSTQVFTVEGVAAEDLSRIIATVYNMLVVTTAPGTGAAGYETLTPTDNIIEYAVALIMANAQGYSRWLYIPSTTCLGDVDTELRRAAAKRMYSAVFTSDCNIDAIKILNVIAPGT